MRIIFSLISSVFIGVFGGLAVTILLCQYSRNIECGWGFIMWVPLVAIVSFVILLAISRIRFIQHITPPIGGNLQKLILLLSLGVLW